MEEAGVTLLDNHWVTLERQGASIVLVGIQDPNGPADRPTPESVFAGMPQGQYTVLLYHRNTEPQVWGPLGANLVLSGHGHGGLVRLPLIGGLPTPTGDSSPDMTPGSTRFRAPRLW